MAEGDRPADLLDEQRLAALAEFAAGAGHEINNPLAIIVGRVQQLLKEEQDPERRQWLLTIGAQAYRVRDMIADAMLFARPPRPELADVPVAEVIETVVSKVQEMAAEQGTTIRWDCEPSLSVRADRTQLAVVLSELLRNALEAVKNVPGRRTISLTAHRNETSSPPVCRLTVTDNGRGLSDLERRHLFDPFFSGRQAGRGLGFGLPKCWRIITNHGGRIEVDSQPTGPTTVWIDWPLAPVEQ